MAKTSAKVVKVSSAGLPPIANSSGHGAVDFYFGRGLTFAGSAHSAPGQNKITAPCPEEFAIACMDANLHDLLKLDSIVCQAAISTELCIR